MTDEGRPLRKPYRRPTLRVYGDVRELTQTTTGGGKTKDKTTGNNKTA